MKRWIYAYRYVPGVPERLERALLAGADGLLRSATGSPEVEPAADGSFPMELEGSVAGIEVPKRIRVSLGVAYRSGRRLLLPVRWHAEPGRGTFPAFEGTLELAPLDARTAQLSLAGSYRPPLGPLGALVDATVLQGVAQRTADRLVRELARALGRRPAAAAEPAPGGGPRYAEPLRVRDVMTDEPLLLDARMPLRTAALLLFHAEISGAPVATDEGELVGVLSERDLLAKEATVRFGWGRRAAEEERRRRARTAGDACTRPARVTVPDARLADAARAMLDTDVSRLVVVDEGRIAGIVSRHDVLAALLREDTDIAEAIQRVLDAHERDGVQVTVTWGEARLTGHTRLRSTASLLPGLVEGVEGVMSVDAGEVSWDEDDVVQPVPFV